MNEPITLQSLIPIFGVVVGTILSALVGMVLSNVRDVRYNLARLNGRLVDHVENKDLHYAAQARTEQQIAHLLQTIKAAHERMDRVEEKA